MNTKVYQITLFEYQDEEHCCIRIRVPTGTPDAIARFAAYGVLFMDDFTARGSSTCFEEIEEKMGTTLEVDVDFCN